MIDIKLGFLKEWKADKHPLVLFVPQDASSPEGAAGLPEKLTEPLLSQARQDGFKGREGDALLVRPLNAAPAERVYWVGVGKKADVAPEVLRRSAARAVKGLEALGIKEAAMVLPRGGRSGDDLDVRAFVEGLILGQYRFDRHKSAPARNGTGPVEKIRLLLGDAGVSLQDVKEAAAAARLYAEATALARDLVNEPPSRMNPARLAEEATVLAGPQVTVKVFQGAELEKLGMGALIGVGSGGAVPPRLVELIYKPVGKSRRTVALVGKGITFDSGGLSLKPAQSMETMKDDMSGAAAVIGVFKALPALKPPVEVRGYLAIAENMPGGRAQKPGDVLKTFSGKTIEVLNTDAEGRLVLSDALAYAGSKKPDVMIDIATLTGACVIALGHLVAAILSPDKGLSDAILRAGEEAGEPFWPLPLVKEYQPDIKSKIADVKNIGGRRGEAGTIIGGLFLQEFVPSGIPWAHLDIAGPSWTDSDGPLCPTGGTGHPVRTLLRYIESLSKKG